MTRAELEHAIRAACDLTGETEVYVFGSQAILGQYPDAPEPLRRSAEADMAPKHAIELADMIDANLGEGSTFHDTHGFYVHGVPIETAVLPRGWEGRAVPVRNTNTRNNTGWCVELHDLAASKLVAYREKDLEFVRALISYDLITPKKLRLRIAQLPQAPTDPERTPRLQDWFSNTLQSLGLAGA